VGDNDQSNHGEDYSYVPQGNVKVNSKPAAFVKFYNTIKSQISSAKLQINLKSQYSMTKTFANIAARQDVKSGEPVMMPFGTMAEGSFVSIFEFGSLGFV
jgi:hypothetical protein